MTKALTPYGVTEAGRREFTHLCNDQNENPTDLSRHAAKPGVSLRVVDVRDPFSDLRFVKDFEAAARFCRTVIDAYIQYRIDSVGGEGAV